MKIYKNHIQAIWYGICHNFYIGVDDNQSNRGSLTSMCILTNHQFISGFRTVLATLKKIIDSGLFQNRQKTGRGLNEDDFFWNRNKLIDAVVNFIQIQFIVNSHMPLFGVILLILLILMIIIIIYVIIGTNYIVTRIVILIIIIIMFSVIIIIVIALSWLL